MGNKIKFMSSVDVPNIDVSNTTTTKILDVQNAIVNDAEIETAEIFDLKVTGEATINTMRNTQDGVSLGGAVVGANIAIGNGADGSGTGSIAVGNNAIAAAENAIQIGAGTNNTANSLQIGDNNIYDVEKNGIHLHQLEKSETITTTTGELYRDDNGGTENEFKDFEWSWDITVDIGKNLDIEILSSSIQVEGAIRENVLGKYDPDTGYITFSCAATTNDNRGFRYGINYEYKKIDIRAATARLQPHQLQVSNISLLSQYDSETKKQRDLDTILQNIDSRLNKLERKSFRPTELEDVWNFLANNDGVHGIYIKHLSGKYTYASGILFHVPNVASTIGIEAYALQGIGYTSESIILLTGIQIIRRSNGYTAYAYPQSAPPYEITDIQSIEIN